MDRCGVRTRLAGLEGGSCRLTRLPRRPDAEITRETRKHSDGATGRALTSGNSRRNCSPLITGFHYSTEKARPGIMVSLLPALLFSETLLSASDTQLVPAYR